MTNLCRLLDLCNIVVLLSAVWTLSLTAPIFGSTGGEKVVECQIIQIYSDEEIN